MWLSRRHLIISVLIGIVAMLGAYSYLSAMTAKRPVVVASQDIEPFIRIERSMLSVEQIPVGLIHPASVADPELVVGQYCTRGLYRGEQLITDSLVQPGFEAGGIPWRLAADQRAVAVPCPPTSAAGGTVRPGHLVDVIYFRESSMHGPASARQLLSAITVLDVRDSSGSPWSSGTGDAPGSLVLAVSPSQAEALTYAMATGKVYVALSPYDPVPYHSREGVTAGSMFEAGGDRGD